MLCDYDFHLAVLVVVIISIIQNINISYKSMIKIRTFNIKANFRV